MAIFRRYEWVIFAALLVVALLNVFKVIALSDVAEKVVWGAILILVVVGFFMRRAMPIHAEPKKEAKNG